VEFMAKKGQLNVANVCYEFCECHQLGLGLGLVLGGVSLVFGASSSNDDVSLNF